MTRGSVWLGSLRGAGRDNNAQQQANELAHGSCGHQSEAANLEARACKEILLTISVLIPKLQAARYVVTDDDVEVRSCRSCDGG